MLLDVNFNINDRFCDAADLKESWDTDTIPDPLLSLLNFFATLFNFDMNDYKNLDNRDQIGKTDGDDQVSVDSCNVCNSKRRQMYSKFQMMYFILHNCRKERHSIS